jgi:hypothetical protein
MAEKPFFPGFEGDDEPAKPQPKPAPAAAPAFDPFAGAPVKAPSANDPAPQPAAAAPAPTAKRPAPPPAAPPPSDEGDVKPGSRKDLWKCPHCGAGNKPDRTTCRTCGKSPEDEVVVPWTRKPAVLAGIVGGVIVLIVAIVLLTRADLSLHPAGAASVDAKPRLGGSASGSYELSSQLRLVTERRVSVSGRIVATKTSGDLVWIALALGKTARDDDAFKEAKAENDPEGGFDFDGGVVFMRGTQRAIAVKVDEFRSE